MTQRPAASATTRPPIQLAALIVGAVSLLVGVLGFVPAINGLHLSLGAAMIAGCAAGAAPRRDRGPNRHRLSVSGVRLRRHPTPEPRTGPYVRRFGWPDPTDRTGGDRSGVVRREATATLADRGGECGEDNRPPDPDLPARTALLRCAHCERRPHTHRTHPDPFSEARIHGWLVTPERTLCPGCATAR